MLALAKRHHHFVEDAPYREHREMPPHPAPGNEAAGDPRRPSYSKAVALVVLSGCTIAGGRLFAGDRSRCQPGKSKRGVPPRLRFVFPLRARSFHISQERHHAGLHWSV